MGGWYNWTEVKKLISKIITVPGVEWMSWSDTEVVDWSLSADDDDVVVASTIVSHIKLSVNMSNNTKTCGELSPSY